MIQRVIGTENIVSGLILRVTLGIVLFPHGAQKLLGWFGGHGPVATIEAFGQLGLPYALAVAVIATESVGAILLIIGFLTRLCALMVAASMGGAMVLLHWQNGFFMNWSGHQTGEGFEFHLLAVGLALGLMAQGGGLGSMDRILTRD